MIATNSYSDDLLHKLQTIRPGLRRLYHCCMMIGLSLLLACSGANAQELATGRSYTGTEKIGFAFHKLGKIPPDFQSWITSKKQYKQSIPAQRAYYLKTEVDRLWQGYEAYVPETDMIDLSLDAVVIQTPPSATDDETHKVPLIFQAPLEEYFPVKVGNIWVALIPKNYQEFRVLNFSAPQYRQLEKFSTFNKNDEAAVFVRLNLKPVAVDTRQPILLDGLELWPMLVEIGSLSLWTPNEAQFLWAYDAPWYHPTSDRDLYSLHK